MKIFIGATTKKYRLKSTFANNPCMNQVKENFLELRSLGENISFFFFFFFWWMRVADLAKLLHGTAAPPSISFGQVAYSDLTLTLAPSCKCMP